MDLTEALDGARTLAHVDELARAFWGATGAGQIADADAERVTARIAAARERIRPPEGRGVGVPLARLSGFPPRRRRCVSPDRLASRARRRVLGLAGAMPHALAARFTEGERAVLAIVAAEVKAKGVCDLALEAIAARAGCCVTSARDAIRLAAAGGLVVTVERRRPGRPSLPNLVRIVSREWRAWVWRRGGGCRNANPTNNSSLTPSAVDASPKGRAKGRGGREGETIGQGATGPKVGETPSHGAARRG